MNKTFVLTAFRADGTVEPQQEYTFYRNAETALNLLTKDKTIVEISIDCFYDDPETGEERGINRRVWKR